MNNTFPFPQFMKEQVKKYNYKVVGKFQWWIFRDEEGKVLGIYGRNFKIKEVK